MTDNRVSDELLTLGDLRKANVARQEFWGGSDNWTLADWSNALAGEVGEACNVVKKLRRPQLGTIGNTADAEDYLAQLESELGDVLIYLDLLARAAGLDLATCVMRAFNDKSDKLKMPIRLQPSLCQELSERRSQEAAGWRDVLAERERQKAVEGWTPEHDDTHDEGQMARAAGLYALAAGINDRRFIERGTYSGDNFESALKLWPWARSWWKPTSRRRDLVKAGALILAEIERLDRVAAPPREAANPSSNGEAGNE